MFSYYYEYNGGMNENKFSPYSTCCGRPMHYAPHKECGCDSGCRDEYPCSRPACIKKQLPDCTAKAVIPEVTVETVEGITNLANCFVHVTSINTTYYIDDKHRVMITWAGPIEIDSYDIEANPLNIRSQSVYTEVESVYSHVYFDKRGVAHIMGREA